jgi:aspartyl/asparaginyl-tRNA synthetase
MTEEAESSKPPTKSALKKASKAAEKARTKAEKSAARELEHRQRESLPDFAADHYGDRTLPQLANLQSTKWIQLGEIEKWEDQTCVLRTAIENTRIQSAKLAFLTLRQGLESIQLVAAEDGVSISRPMVKYIGNISPESICVIHAVVKRTAEPIKSTTVKGFELHAQKVYTISKAQASLPLQPADSENALPLEEKTITDADQHSSGPLVSLNTRLNNRVLDLRARTNHCIFLLKDGVDSLFQEFLRSEGFIRIHSPKIINAASEGFYSTPYSLS